MTRAARVGKLDWNPSLPSLAVPPAGGWQPALFVTAPPDRPQQPGFERVGPESTSGSSRALPWKAPLCGQEATGLSRSQLALLRAYGIRPVKRRGQNFLIDNNLARAIAREVTALGMEVLELGAGAGALTGPLLEAGAQVTAVEIDRHLCRLLREEWGQAPRLRLQEVDLTRLDWDQALAAAGGRPVVAGNLPYVLTSSVLFALAQHAAKVAGAVLTVQREVAARLTAVPGNRDYGVLAVLLGALFDCRIVRTVPPAVFWPRPEVESAVVRLTPAAAGWPAGEYARFGTFVKQLFAQRRKRLATLLRGLTGLSAGQLAELLSVVGLTPDLRPEQVPPAALRELARRLWRETAS